MTQESSTKFFWIHQINQSFKLFWAEHQNDQATGSLSLSLIEAVLVGNLSQEFVRCKLTPQDARQMQPKLFQHQQIPFQVTLLSEKRDLTLRFQSFNLMEIWVAVVVKLASQVRVLVE